MADAATIGASMSQYTGNAALGGGGLGAVKLDFRPVEDFAKYVMLYNRAEWEQKQKETEKAAEELANFASLDLSTTIPKHAKILQGKYDELYDWVRQNPDALKYRVEDSKGNLVVNEKFIEYRKKKADLMNDIAFAKKNSVLNEVRKTQIAETPNEKIKSFLQSKLDKEIEEKDIRDTLDHSPKYDLTLPDWGQNKGQSLEVMVRGDNDTTFKQSLVFDAAEGKRISNVYSLGLAGIDPNTETGMQQYLLLNNNPLVQGAAIFNTAVANAMQSIDPNKTDAEKDEELKTKVNNLGIMKAVNQYNEYMADMRTAIKEKRFSDEFSDRLKESDYTDINFKDGISPDELSLLAQFSSWEGDKTALRQVQTNNLIEQQRLAAEWARIAAENRRIALAEEQMNQQKGDVVADVSSVLNSVTQMVLTGEKRIIQSPDGSSSEVTVISDPDLMKQFGTLEADGSVKDAPDAIQYDPVANKIFLRYYQTGRGTKNLPSGTFLLDDAKNKSMEPTEFLTSLIKKKFPNKDIGQIGSLVNKWYEASNNNLSNLANNYNIYSRSLNGGTPGTQVVTKPGETIVTGKSGKTIVIPN